LAEASGSLAQGEDLGKSQGEGKVFPVLGKKWVILISLVVSILISGCRVTYLLHAGVGHFRLLNGSIPVEDALKENVLNAREKDHLRLVAQVKAFGERELGLKRTQNYETINLRSRQSPIYTVSASPKDRLSRKTWWFPIVGDMPYLGFFDLSKARKEKERLAVDGLDVNIGVADAYSTLGWFRDPLTLNLIKGHTVDLVEVILHEMTHATLYLKGEGEFNETLAVLVGKVGAFQYLRTTYGSTHPLTTEARNSIDDERIFSSFLNSVLEDLEHLYSSPIEYREKLFQREKIFASALQRFNRLKESFKTQDFDGFGHAEINNSYLLSISLYHRNFHLFEVLLKRNEDSVSELLLFLENLANEQGAIMDGVRKRVSEKSAEIRRLNWLSLKLGRVDG
jgi:predicted aminopeptidase